MHNLLNTIMDVLMHGQRIVIAGHENPDGDAVGACYALAMCLEKMGKSPQVVLDSYSEKYEIIPGKRFLYQGDLNALNPEIFIALDCGSAKRLGRAEALFLKAPISIAVDHHTDTDQYATYNLFDETASSTCELIFGIVNQFIPIDRDIAAALYAGIVFDTGGFCHNCTSPKTHDIAAKLMALDIPFDEIYNELLHVRSLTEGHMLAKALSTMTIGDTYPIACVFVTTADMEEVGASSRDLEGIVNYALNLRGVSVSVFMYPADGDKVKVSMRSRGADIQKVAAKFGGGGHRRAAGCAFYGTIEQAFAAILPLVKEALNDEKH